MNFIKKVKSLFHAYAPGDGEKASVTVTLWSSDHEGLLNYAIDFFRQNSFSKKDEFFPVPLEGSKSLVIYDDIISDYKKL